MTIETERLVLRTIHIEDAADIFEYSKRPEVGPNAGWAPHESVDETIEIMKLIFLEKDDVFGIVLKESGKMIGSIGVIDDPKRENDGAGMLGYAISDEHWGRGYMTEAAKAAVKFGFETKKLDIISAYCYPENARSQRVIEKCGLKYEGTLRKAEKLYNGEIKDNMCYSLTAADYFKTENI